MGKTFRQNDKHFIKNKDSFKTKKHEKKDNGKRWKPLPDQYMDGYLEDTKET